MQSDPLPKIADASNGPVSPGGTSQDIEDFIYLISHDVRSSVRALLELPQWIAEDLEEAGFPINGPVAASIEMMNRHTGRLDRMLVDLLTFSRVGRMQEVRCVDLEAAVDRVVEELDLPAGFEVLRDFQVKEITIGERDVLTLLSALIQNAVKHHDQSKGRIVVTFRREKQAVVIGVADDGPGIPDEFRERVFGAMTTLQPRDEVEGSGMGLANVRKIARYYGGDAVSLASPYGRGSNIEVRMAVT